LIVSAPPSPTDFSRTDNEHRAPERRQFTATTRPLIVTGTFVSRVDDTPHHARPHDEGSSKGRDGEEVTRPEQQPEALAIEPDPNLAFEHWDEYWRKVHGPKFAWNEPGSSSELVLRYDQLHRIASGPSCFFPPPYRAMVDEAGLLPADPERRVPAFRRPRWDGLAYIVYAAEQDIARTLDQEKFARRIIADEQVAFRMVTREVLRETIFIPSPRHRDPISLVRIHVRQPGLTRDEFARRLLDEHAITVMAQPATHAFVRRYVQLHNLGSTQEDPEGSRIDAVSILGFASMNDVEDYLVSPGHAAIEASETALAGEGSEWWTALNYSVINRLLPELATELAPERATERTTEPTPGR